jgi:hypothetical protein
MKFVINVFLVSLFLTACGVEVTTPKPEEPKKDPLPTTKVDTKVSPYSPCTYKENLGCIKAIVSTTKLTVGNLYYDLGVIAFAKNLPKDLADIFNQERKELHLKDNQTLEFSRIVTLQNFHSNFNIITEGDSQIYRAINPGDGSIQINNMFPGSYTIQVTKEFDLKVLEGDKTVGYTCILISATYLVDILSDQSTTLPQSVSQFDLTLPREGDERKSCNGTKVRTDSSPSSSSSTED